MVQITDNACTSNTNCIQTDLFTLAGKIATNNGLDIQQATYTKQLMVEQSMYLYPQKTEQNIEVSVQD